jgi:hypothetical protein
MAVSAVVVIAMAASLWMFVSTSDAPADLVSEQAKPLLVTLNSTELTAAASFRPFQGSIPVVAYHDVSGSGAPDSITPEQFAAQMSILDQAGFMTVTLEQVRSLVMGRAVQLPANPILLTFDGGDLATWVSADPILAQHGFGGAVFIATSRLQTEIGSTYLNIDTVKKMIATGRWSVGGNTHLGDRLVSTDTGEVPWLVNRLTLKGHTETIDEWRQRVLSDLTTNQEQLVSQLGVTATSMSFPAPLNALVDGEPALAALLPEIIGARFELGFQTGENPTAVNDGSVVTALPRVRGYGVNTDPIAFLGAIDESIPRPSPGSLQPTAWVMGGQGACLSENDTLVIADEGYTSCRLQTAIADQWSDVRTSAYVSGISASASASIRVRETPTSRLEVTMTNNKLLVTSFVDGSPVELASIPLDLAATNGSVPILIEVRGTLLVVTADQIPPLRVQVPPASAPGGVSFAATTSGAGVITFTTLNIITFNQPDTGTQ